MTDAEMRAEIEEAFRDVTRKGGVSWRETEVLDNYGSDTERAAARSLDTDHSWKEAAADPKWDLDPGVGGFSFLDPIGFRYYLPAAMVSTVANREGYSILYQLTLPEEWTNLRSHHLEQWSLLDHEQRLSVRRFIEYMIRQDMSAPPDHEWEVRSSPWQGPYDGYWKSIPEENPTQPKKKKHSARRKAKPSDRF